MTYEELYRNYYPRVTRYLAGMVGDADAEDLAQEVFLKVERKLGSLRDPSRASAWIFRIALNTARDRLRKPSVVHTVRAPSASSANETWKDPLETAADIRTRTAEEVLVRREMIRCFLDFVTKLPASYYQVYALSEFEELPDKMISRRLSLPLETVKMRLHRARTKLYEQLRANCRCYVNERGELMGRPK